MKARKLKREGKKKMRKIGKGIIKWGGKNKKGEINER